LVLTCTRGASRRRRRRIGALSAIIAFVFVAAFAAESRAATYTVGITQDTTGICDVPSGGKCSLRQLVNYENGLKATPNPVDTIQVPAGSYVLNNGVLSISQSVSIVGAGAASTTIQQLSATPDRVFDVQAQSPAGTTPTVSISGLRIESGTANQKNGSLGGNVRNQGNLTLDEDWIFSGTAGSGGGISNDGGGLVVKHSLVSDNTATTTDGNGDSGGIQNFGDNTVGAGSLTVLDSTISNNSAQVGGGVESRCGNTPCDSSGANNRTSIVNSTITNNQAVSAGGGLLQASSRLGSQGTIGVQNSIVAFNTVGGSASNCAGSGIGSSGYNIETGSECGFTKTGDLQKTDPGFTFTSYLDNGGSTRTFALDAKSPAVDAIPVGSPNCDGTDQREIARPQGTGCDIGAVEVFQPTEGQSATVRVLATDCGNPFGQATIDWGDGTPTSLSNSQTFIGTHTYAEAGLYAGSVSYQDDCGTHTKVPIDIKVQDAPLTAKASAVNATAGATFRGEVATFTDGKPDAPVSDFTTTIDWGDGTSSAGKVSSITGGYSVTGSHIYSTPGPYQTTIEIDDTDGSTTSVQGSANVAAPPPTVTGVSPAFGPAAGGTSVTISGTNLSAATSVKFGANAATITTDTATSITATAPAGTGTVDVTVTTAGGTSATSGADQFTYGPTVTGVSPTSGPAAGGTVVTITGTGFTNLTGASFGNQAATSFTFVSDTKITATSPGGGTGTVDITVTTPAGTSPTGAADQFSYGPTVTSVSPAAGPTGGGTSVTITGTNFSGATAVTFGANPAKFTFKSVTQITAVAPASTAGTVHVAVTTPAGTSPTGSADQYTYVAAPAVTSVSPNAGPTSGGTSVTITGTNLGNALAVSFGNVGAIIVSNTATTIVATAPAESAGKVDVTVTTVGGTSATGNGDQYTYVPAPTVMGISPSSGPAAGGTSVTITGTNLSGASGVQFGNASATITSNSATSIVVTSPVGTGTVDVTVTTAGGTSATSRADQFAYGPTVSSVAPTAGPAAGGTDVVIIGTGLTNVTDVSFGTTAATSFTPVSDTRVLAKSPAGTGTVDITVTTPAGTSPTSAADQFSYGPAVTGLSPSSGRTAGGTSVTITGVNFTGVNAVRFGDAPANSFHFDSDTQITAFSAPGNAGSVVDVTVVTGVGTSPKIPGDHYTYVAAPTVESVSPTSGPTAGGTDVTITGSNLAGATVKFGTVTAPTSSNTATTIVARAPAQPAGTVDISVTTAGGTSATGAGDQYTYVPPPTVTGVNPTHGPAAGGTSVTITGSSLAGASSVKFGSAIAAITSKSATSIVVTAPAGTGAVDVTVTTAGGTSATGPGDQYTYVAAPTVSGVSPNSGPTAGGTSVTISGTDLTGATAVQFGGAAASSFTVNGPGQIAATSPPGSGTVDVTVTTVGGTSAKSSADQYSYSTPPPNVVPASPNIKSSGAALSASVNPNGSPTAAHWEYGLDPAYRGPGFSGNVFDQSTPQQTVGADFANHTVTATLTNLLPQARYRLRLVASNGAGTTIGPEQTLTTPEAPSPPRLVLGNVNLTPSGTVFILENGHFVKLTQTLQLSSGTVIDALGGSVTIDVASGGVGTGRDAKANKAKPRKKPTKFTGTFGGAVFRVSQAKAGPNRGLTTLSIVEGAFKGAPSYASCTAKRGAGEPRLAHAALSSRIVQSLRSRASGRFRTRGRYAAGTVRGTQWTTTDRCDGTLIAVQVHAVQVTDLVRHITRLITAGHSYLARARR
jgi:hypothetical protein